MWDLSKLHRRRTPRFVCIIILAPLATLALVTSCNFPDIFGAYNQRSLLAGNGLDAWKTDQTSPYMTYQQVSPTAAGGTAGLPSGYSGAIYRLEVNNLMPDGDFEAATLPTGWFDADTNQHHYLITSSSGAPRAIDGQSIEMDTEQGKSVYFNLSYLADGAVANAVYAPHFEFTLGDTNSPLTYQFTNAADVTGNDQPYQWDISGGNTTPGTVLSAPLASTQDLSFVAGDRSPPLLAFGKWNGLQKISLDNLRIVRTDIPLRLRFDVPYHDSTGTRPDLLNGHYRFSVYVRVDPTNTIDGTAAHVENRFPADAVSIGINLIAGSTASTNGALAVFHPTDSGASNWANWTLLQTDAYSVQFSTPSDPATDILELYISPMDVSAGPVTRDARSVLIADPELVFSPN